MKILSRTDACVKRLVSMVKLVDRFLNLVIFYEFGMLVLGGDTNGQPPSQTNAGVVR